MCISMFFLKKARSLAFRVRALPRLAIFGVLLLAPFTAFAAEYAIGPVPAWVKTFPLPAAPDNQTEQTSQGVQYVMVDFQTLAEKDKSSFRHFATRAVNASGLENIAHISINFDPTYQSLTLHSILVHRFGNTSSRLKNANIRLLQRETDIERRVYDGSKTLDVYLDDIRTGDIVEYSYTLQGNNPVFHHRLMGRFDFQWDVPVAELYARLVVPKDRKIYLEARHTSLPIEAHSAGNYLEYQWHLENQPGMTVESHAPGWYDPYPAIEWSEFQDWQSVVAWALPLYRAPEKLGENVQSEVSRINQIIDDPATRLLLALQFVQSEIRYLGIESGVNSHAPTSPEIVASRRFGDCKDKALLTVTMLRALGFDAVPALVNTSSTRGLSEVQPSPMAFDHVIVHVRFEGKNYWLDPTLPQQEGDLEHIYQPDYGYALLVAPEEKALTPMTEATASKVNQRNIHAVFDASKGMNAPVDFTVTTVFQGRSADQMRGTLADESPENLQKAFLNFYAGYYPGTSVVAPFKVEKSNISNSLTITEHYRIPEFWKHSDKYKRQEADIDSPDLETYLKSPDEVVRKAPLAVSLVDLTLQTDVILHEEWGIEESQVSIKNNVFQFDRQVQERNRKITLSNHLRYLSDHVMPDEIPKYVADLDRIRDVASYAIYQNDEKEAPVVKENGFNWLIAIIGVTFFGAWMWLALKVYRYDPPRPTHPVDPKLRGISGWLLLPALGLIVSPIQLLISFFGDLSAYSIANWNLITTPGAENYHPLWAPTLLFELAVNLGLIVFWILLAIMFFQTRRAVPRLYIGLQAALLATQIMDTCLTLLIPNHGEFKPEDIAGIFQPIMSLCIWGAYFMCSERVKSTFINTWKKTQENGAPGERNSISMVVNNEETGT